MNRRKQLKSLFSQLCMELEINNMNEKSTHEVESLKMDFNSIYGGYRIDIVHTNTSESFFQFSSRFTLAEMISYVQGLLYGIELEKKGRNTCTHATRYVENGRVWCGSHCGWSEEIN